MTPTQGPRIMTVVVGDRNLLVMSLFCVVPMSVESTLSRCHTPSRWLSPSAVTVVSVDESLQN